MQSLPARRNAPTMAFDLFDGYSVQAYSAQFAEFADGELAEVFLKPEGGSSAKVGMPLDTMAKDLSVLFSIARRYGAPVSVIRVALSQQADGQMLGPLGEFLRLHDTERGEPDDPAPVQVGPAAPIPSACVAEAALEVA